MRFGKMRCRFLLNFAKQQQLLLLLPDASKYVASNYPASATSLLLVIQQQQKRLICTSRTTAMQSSASSRPHNKKPAAFQKNNADAFAQQQQQPTSIDPDNIEFTYNRSTAHEEIDDDIMLAEKAFDEDRFPGRALDMTSPKDKFLLEAEPLIPRSSYNLATYVNSSETLKRLVDLGVEIYRFDRFPDISQFMLSLDFDRDVQPFIDFFSRDCGITDSRVHASILTECPRILMDSVLVLHDCRNYFLSKKFSPEAFAKIVTITHAVLMMPPRQIHSKLAFIQSTLKVRGDDVRELVVAEPRLITRNRHQLELSVVAIREQLGFKRSELQSMVKKWPGLWMNTKENIETRFDYAHNELKYSHETICNQPQSLDLHPLRMRARHEFLKLLRRNQFDPTKPNYVSPVALATLDDREFSEKCAKVNVAVFNEFIKTL